MPAIISAQLFEQAQEQLQHNSQFAKRDSRRQYLLSGLLEGQLCGSRPRATGQPRPRRDARRQYLLSGLLECQLCGYRLCGKGQRQRRYYYCIGSKEQTRGEQNCVQRYVPAESLEELVWQQVAQLLQQPELILKHYHQLQHQAPRSEERVSR